MHSGVPRVLGRLLVDAVYSLSLYPHSECWTIDMQDTFWSLLTGPYRKHASFEHVLCPKHVLLAERMSSWDSYTELISSLIQHELVTLSNISHGALRVLEMQDESIAYNLAMCLSRLSKFYTSESEHASEITAMLYWGIDNLAQGPHIEALNTCIAELVEVSNSHAEPDNESSQKAGVANSVNIKSDESKQEMLQIIHEEISDLDSKTLHSVDKSNLGIADKCNNPTSNIELECDMKNLCIATKDSSCGITVPAISTADFDNKENLNEDLPSPDVCKVLTPDDSLAQGCLSSKENLSERIAPNSTVLTS